MEYYLKGKNKEFGPYTKIKMLKMVNEGLISLDSKVRSQMLKEWKKASSFSFLKEAIKKRMAEEGEEYQEENTAYENKFIPVPAGATLRVMAFVSELIFLLIISTFFLWLTFGYATAKGKASTPTLETYMSKLKENTQIIPTPEEMIKNREIISKERGPNKGDDETHKIVRGTIWKYVKAKNNVKKYIAINVSADKACWVPVDSINGLLTFFTCVGLIIYFSVTLFLFGVRSQTIGMWFWGIFLVQYDEEQTLKPITADIAFKYFFFSIAIGFTTLIVSLTNPQRRSAQEQITDTWMIRVRSKVMD